MQPDKTVATAAGFLEHLWIKAPFRIRAVLTHNGKEFTERFCTTGECEPTGRLRSTLRRARHPVPPGQAQTPANQRHDRALQRPRRRGVENDRVAEVLKTTAFASARHLETTLQRDLHLHLYSQHLPQQNLGQVILVAKLKEYYRAKPALFQKNTYQSSGA
ncbi:MAG: hypothetical protein WAT67_09915 [Candidatus Contendobacter sp.]